MSNYIDPFDPVFYAQEALIQLEPRLGIANRVYRQLDQDPQQKGSTIEVKRPSSFVAEDMPGTDQDLEPDKIQVKLDQHKGVRFAITDKELTFTREQMITTHIRPAAVAVAKAIDASVMSLYKSVPWILNGTSTPTDAKDIASLWRAMFDNEAPEDDLHLVMNGERWEKFLGITAFTQWQGAGQTGVDAQRTGRLDEKFGFMLAAQQSIATHTSGALVKGGTLQLDADADKVLADADPQQSTIVVKDSTASLTGTVKAGDTLVIAGSTQRYAVVSDATAGSNKITLVVQPGLVVNYLEDATVTIDQPNGKAMNLAFHRNFACLAMASLTELGDGKGADIATIPDPKTNITLRSTVWYDANLQKNCVRLDALWGVKLLDHNLAIRYQL